MALAVVAFMTTAFRRWRKAGNDRLTARRALGLATPAAGSARNLAEHGMPSFVVGTAVVLVLQALLARELT